MRKISGGCGIGEEVVEEENGELQKGVESSQGRCRLASAWTCNAWGIMAALPPHTEEVLASARTASDVHRRWRVTGAPGYSHVLAVVLCLSLS